jgi:ribosomal protein L40E
MLFRFQLRPPIKLEDPQVPFCQKCGAMNPDEATKCSKCGNAFNKERKLGNILILIIAIVMILGTIIGLFFL